MNVRSSSWNRSSGISNNLSPAVEGSQQKLASKKRESTPRLSKKFINKECLKAGSSDSVQDIDENDKAKLQPQARPVLNRAKSSTPAQQKKTADYSSDEYSDDDFEHKGGDENVVTESIQRALRLTKSTENASPKINKFLKLESELDKLKQKEKELRRTIGKQYLDTSKNKQNASMTQSTIGGVTGEKTTKTNKSKYQEKKQSTKLWEMRLRQLNWKPLPPVKEPEIPVKSKSPFVYEESNIRTTSTRTMTGNTEFEETKNEPDPFFKKIFGIEFEEQFLYTQQTETQRTRVDSAPKVTSEDELSQTENYSQPARGKHQKKLPDEFTDEPTLQSSETAPHFLPNYHDNDFEDELIYNNHEFPFPARRYSSEEDEIVSRGIVREEEKKGLEGQEEEDSISEDFNEPSSERKANSVEDNNDFVRVNTPASEQDRFPEPYHPYPRKNAIQTVSSIAPQMSHPQEISQEETKMNELIEIPMIRLSLSEKLAPLLATAKDLSSPKRVINNQEPQKHTKQKVSASKIPKQMHISSRVHMPTKSSSQKKTVSTSSSSPKPVPEKTSRLTDSDSSNPFKIPELPDHPFEGKQSMVYQQSRTNNYDQMIQPSEKLLFNHLKSYPRGGGPTFGSHSRYSHVESSIDDDESSEDDNSDANLQNEFSVVNAVYKTFQKQQQQAKKKAEDTEKGKEQEQLAKELKTQLALEDFAGEQVTSPRSPGFGNGKATSSSFLYEGKQEDTSALSFSSNPARQQQQSQRNEMFPAHKVSLQHAHDFPQNDNFDFEDISATARAVHSATRPPQPPTGSSSGVALRLKMEMMKELQKQDQIFQYALELQDLEKQAQDFTYEVPKLIANKRQQQEQQQQQLFQQQEALLKQQSFSAQKKGTQVEEESNELFRSAEATMQQSERLLDLYMKLQKERQRQQQETTFENVQSLANTLDNIKAINHLEHQINQLPASSSQRASFQPQQQVPQPILASVPSQTSPFSPARRQPSAEKNTMETQTLPGSPEKAKIVIPTVPRMKSTEIQTVTPVLPERTGPMRSIPPSAYYYEIPPSEEDQSTKAKLFFINQKHKERMAWLDQIIENHLSSEEEIDFERRKFESMYHLELQKLTSKPSATVPASQLLLHERKISPVAELAEKIWGKQPEEQEEQHHETNSFEEQIRDELFARNLSIAPKDEMISSTASDDKSPPQRYLESKDMEEEEEFGGEYKLQNESSSSISQLREDIPSSTNPFEISDEPMRAKPPVGKTQRNYYQYDSESEEETHEPTEESNQSYRYDEFESESQSQTMKERSVQQKPSLDVSENYSEDVPEEVSRSIEMEESESDRYQWTESKFDEDQMKPPLGKPTAISNRYQDSVDTEEEEAEENYSSDILEDFTKDVAADSFEIEDEEEEENDRYQWTESHLAVSKQVDDNIPEGYDEVEESLPITKATVQESEFEVDESIKDEEEEEEQDEISDEISAEDEHDYAENTFEPSYSKYSSVEDTKALESHYNADFETVSTSKIDEDKAIPAKPRHDESLYVQDDFEIEDDNEGEVSASKALSSVIEDSQYNYPVKANSSLEYSNDPHAVSSSLNLQQLQEKKLQASAVYSAEDFEIEASDESQERMLQGRKNLDENEEYGDEFESLNATATNIQLTGVPGKSTTVPHKVDEEEEEEEEVSEEIEEQIPEETEEQREEESNNYYEDTFQQSVSLQQLPPKATLAQIIEDSARYTEVEEESNNYYEDTFQQSASVQLPPKATLVPIIEDSARYTEIEEEELKEEEEDEEEYSTFPGESVTHSQAQFNEIQKKKPQDFDDSYEYSEFQQTIDEKTAESHNNYSQDKYEFTTEAMPPALEEKKPPGKEEPDFELEEEEADEEEIAEDLEESPVEEEEEGEKQFTEPAMAQYQKEKSYDEPEQEQEALLPDEKDQTFSYEEEFEPEEEEEETMESQQKPEQLIVQEKKTEEYPSLEEMEIDEIEEMLSEKDEEEQEEEEVEREVYREERQEMKQEPLSPEEEEFYEPEKFQEKEEPEEETYEEDDFEFEEQQPESEVIVPLETPEQVKAAEEELDEDFEDIIEEIEDEIHHSQELEMEMSVAPAVVVASPQKQAKSLEQHYLEGRGFASSTESSPEKTNSFSHSFPTAQMPSLHSSSSSSSKGGIRFSPRIEEFVQEHGDGDDEFKDIVDLNPQLKLVRSVSHPNEADLYDRNQNTSMYYDDEQQKWIGENEEPLVGFESDESHISHEEITEENLKKKNPFASSSAISLLTQMTEVKKPIFPIDITLEQQSQLSLAQEESVELLSDYSENNSSVDFSTHTVENLPETKNIEFFIVVEKLEAENEDEEEEKRQEELQLIEKKADEISSQLLQRLLMETFDDVKKTLLLVEQESHQQQRPAERKNRFLETEFKIEEEPERIDEVDEESRISKEEAPKYQIEPERQEVVVEKEEQFIPEEEGYDTEVTVELPDPVRNLLVFQIYFFKF
jgi:hypothetical protein